MQQFVKLSDWGGGELIDSEALAQLSSLRAGARGIVNLTGLEACTGLEQLHLHLNQIVDLAPLSELQSLRSVSLNGNNIIDVSPLSQLLQLTSLAIHGNQIADVRPISLLPLLTSLSIGNAIEDIEPLVKLPSLERLMVYVLPTTDLSPLHQMHNLEFLLVSSGQALSGRAPFDSTILASCSNLASLRLDGYDIARIAELAESVPTLTELALHYIGVDDISMFQIFDALTKLTLYGIIPSSEEVDLSHLDIPSGVTTLALENNGVEDVAVIASFTSLTSLSLARNSITNIEGLETLVKLTVLDLSFNAITDLAPLRELPALKSLTLQGVPFDRTAGSDALIVIDELRTRGVNVYY